MVNTKGTGDSPEKITSYLKRVKNKFTRLDLKWAVGDSVAEILFPHRELPHYVWIGKNMRVLAITGSEMLTKENIDSVLRKESVSFAVKTDVFLNKIINIGDSEVNINDSFLHYSFFKKGMLKQYGKVNKLRIVKNSNSTGVFEIRGKVMLNMSIIEMYEQVGRLYKGFNNINFHKRFFSNSLLLSEGSQTEIGFDVFLKNDQSVYNYDLVIPSNQADSLFNYMLYDLNHYSNIKGQIVKRSVKCLALIRSTCEDKIESRGGEKKVQLDNDFDEKLFLNNSLDLFVQKLDWGEISGYPVINETGYKKNVDLKFVSNISDLYSLKKELQNYGLDLVLVQKDIEMFELDKKSETLY
jgi:hypothetical protein